MRHGNWKVVFNRSEKDATPQLFDLTADIGEENNLADAHPDQLKEMLARLAEWESQLIEPMWGGGRAASEDD